MGPPMDSLVRLGVSLATTIPTGFYSQRFWGFTSQHWDPGLHGLSCSSVVPSGLSACKCGTAWSSSHCLTLPIRQPPPYLVSSRPQLLVSTPLTHLDECFFFNSSVVRHPYSSILWQFWLFLFLNWILSFFWLCEEVRCICLCLHLGWKSGNCITVILICIFFLFIRTNFWLNFLLFVFLFCCFLLLSLLFLLFYLHQV